ncbi:MAG: long-chain fatty acid--CoA ligase [Firmicutes bacterium]|nr:long-chain fatty acid--CoA ligase [Bacillota bacterium]
MMKTPLTLRPMFEYATTYFPDQQIVARQADGLTRRSYRDTGRRVRQLASALAALGVTAGDRVGTFLWNDAAHLEAYFAIPSLGAVLHTINLRLPADHLAYVINHAADRVLIVDRALWPVLAPLRASLSTVRAIILTGTGYVGEPDPPGTLDYDTLLAQGDPAFAWAELEEDQPLGLCYTSATTGYPKGVLYSHRGIYLHSLGLGLANTFGISADDTVLPIVPMFHANAWGLPFAAFWFGAKIVLPGPAPRPAVLLDLLRDEQVTVAIGVPTVWLALAQELERRPAPLALRAAICGGAAAPPALIRRYEKIFHIPFLHGYGMTETSPVATVARLKPSHRDLSEEAQLRVKASQGMPLPGLTVRLEREGRDVPWDGEAVGELCIQGPWIADAYEGDARTAETFRDGWLHTGDVATIDSEGYVRLVDRTKDVIKSGGEWISSVDLENALMAHPAVLEAAVVGIPHPRWGERPLAFVVVKEGMAVTKEELLAALGPQFARWQWPDDVIWVAEVPKTSVGKFLKRALREQYQDYFAPR